ncbi:hypothetical protein PIB30_096374 [Stylosanthes scabra]|uniref:Uncharacterized protein n=1 Tax=Stylosanthes scabra TaxID=79078 RepID=A0ABU6TXG2_9FABA|nr:hypothetical protein [Stylosanthes scabra]
MKILSWNCPGLAAPATGLSGELCLFWKSNVNIKVYEWCDNYIKANISNNQGTDWNSVFAYGNPTPNQEKSYGGIYRKAQHLTNNLQYT